MFSKSCEYAIKAMLFVAQKSKDNLRIGVKEIAAGIDAPETFIAKILQELGKKKLINSAKGPNGGFYMNEFTSKISLADIVKAIDGDGIYRDCVIGLKACVEKNPCPVHFEYREIRENLIKMLEHSTISAFNENLDAGKFFLKHA